MRPVLALPAARLQCGEKREGLRRQALHLRRLFRIAAVGYVIGKVKSGEGNIQKITYAEMEERFDTSLTPENGFCKLLAEELKQRKEFSFVAFYNDELCVTLRSDLRDSEQSVPEREETEETLGTVQGM